MKHLAFLAALFLHTGRSLASAFSSFLILPVTAQTTNGCKFITCATTSSCLGIGLSNPICDNGVCVDLDSLKLTQLAAFSQPPNNVFIMFRTTDSTSAPYSQLNLTELSLTEDGEAISVESHFELLPTPIVRGTLVHVLFDLSSRIVSSLSTVKAALSAFVFATLAANSAPSGPTAYIAISVFTGAPDIIAVVPFSNNATVLNESIYAFQTSQTGSTNLNGAIVQALDMLRQAPVESGVLTTRALAIFTDGKDRAHLVSDSAAISAVQNSHALVFVVGLLGEIVPSFLQQIGQSGYFEISSIDSLKAKFVLVADSITMLTSASYIVGYCSPSRALRHDFAVSLGKSRVSINFDAGSFTGECSIASLEACNNCKTKLQVSSDQQLLSCGGSPQPERTGPNTGVILGVVFGLLGALAIGVVGFLVWRKFKNDGYVWSPLVL